MIGLATVALLVGVGLQSAMSSHPVRGYTEVALGALVSVAFMLKRRAAARAPIDDQPEDSSAE